MKTALLVGLVLGCVFFAGCETFPGLPGAGASDQLLAVEEIDRSMGRARDELRMRRLTDVAQRPDLDPIVQVYLVHRAYDNLSIPENKTRLFLLLIENPAFSLATQQEIVSRINELGADENKAAIMQALRERSQAKFEHAVQTQEPPR